MSNDPSSHLPESEEQLTRRLEYSEDVNVPEIHAAILREKEDPVDGEEPLPLWMVLCFSVLIAWCFWYLGNNSGGFRSDIFHEGPGSNPGVVASASGPAVVDPVALGKRVFSGNCAACHQATGQGVAGQYPPLAGSEWVNGGTARLGRILLHGLNGVIVVQGTPYNGNMPAWGKQLKDEQIANVLTYVRQEWGNKGGPVTVAQITALKAELAARSDPWIDAELKPFAAVDLAGAAPASATPPAAPAPAKP
jgi:mono/diheme cytochrome c family protein